MRAHFVPHTFNFSFEYAKIVLIHGDKSLLPVSCSLDHLADLLGFLLIGERTYPVTRYDVLEHRQLREYRQLPDDGIVWYRVWVGGRRDFPQRKCMQASEEANLRECESWKEAGLNLFTLFSGSATMS